MTELNTIIDYFIENKIDLAIKAFVNYPECLFSLNVLIVEGITDRRVIRSILANYDLPWTIIVGNGCQHNLYKYFNRMGNNFICLYDTDIFLNSDNTTIHYQSLDKIFDISPKLKHNVFLKCSYQDNITFEQNLGKTVFDFILYESPLYKRELVLLLLDLFSEKYHTDSLCRRISSLSKFDVILDCYRSRIEDKLKMYPDRIDNEDQDLVIYFNKLVVCNPYCIPYDQDYFQYCAKTMLGRYVRYDRALIKRNVLSNYLGDVNKISTNNNIYVWPPTMDLFTDLEDIWQGISKIRISSKLVWHAYNPNYLNKVVRWYKNNFNNFQPIEDFILRLRSQTIRENIFIPASPFFNDMLNVMGRPILSSIFSKIIIKTSELVNTTLIGCNANTDIDTESGTSIDIDTDISMDMDMDTDTEMDNYIEFWTKIEMYTNTDIETNTNVDTNKCIDINANPDMDSVKGREMTLIKKIETPLHIIKILINDNLAQALIISFCIYIISNLF